jgi:hypothetical protein
MVAIVASPAAQTTFTPLIVHQKGHTVNENIQKYSDLTGHVLAVKQHCILARPASVNF